MAQALDVAQPQCLVFYEADDHFQWHHRVLLVKGPAQQWVWLTPDGEVAYADLAGFRVLALQRGGAFPARHAGNIYSFDDLPADDLAGYLREANALGHILGFDSVADAPAVGSRWFVSDPISSHFGEEVPAGAVGNDDVMVARGSVGLVCIDSTWVSAVRVDAGASFESYLSRARSGPGRDPRVVADERDSDQVRFLSFRDSVTRIREQTFPGWPLKGVRAAREATVALRDAGQNSWGEHRATWVRRSGVPGKSNTAREHRMLCTVMRIFQQYDQLDLYNIAGIEYLVRRLKQLEAATRRNPRQPDFEGLDVVLDSTIDESGALVLPGFDTWIGDQQRAEAAVLKAGRQWREENANTRKQKGGGGGKDNEDKK